MNKKHSETSASYSPLVSAIQSVLSHNIPSVSLLIATVLIASGLQVFPALLIRRIVDNHFAKGIAEGVWTLAFCYLGVTIALGVGDFIKVLITTYLSQNILMQLRLKLAERLSLLPMSYYAKTPVGETMSRMTSDVDAVGSLFSSGFVGVLTDCFQVFGLGASLFILSPVLGTVTVLTVPVIYVLSNYFRKNVFQKELAVRRSISAINSFIQEWLGGLVTVKAYGLEKNGRKKFQTPLNDFYSAFNAVCRYESWFPCIMQTLRALTIAVILWLGMRNGTPFSLGLSVGTLAAAADLIGKLFAPVEALATEFQTIQEAMAGLRRIGEFFSQPTELRDSALMQGEKKNGFSILARDVAFSYDKKSKVLRRISLEIEKGQRIALVGKTGAGKTTLMQLISGLYQPDSGTISVCGCNPYHMPPSMRRKIIGVVPQNVNLFEGSIRDNISLRDDTISLPDIRKAAEIVGLSETIAALPDGYDTQLGEGAAHLSYGETQLLSMARAIVTNPEILLLDEPTSGLDMSTESQVFEAIKKASEGRTILTISHRLSGIVDADSVYILEQGKIVEQGAPDVLAGKEGWYSVFKRLEGLGWQSE